jgi:hypothetical protein
LLPRLSTCLLLLGGCEAVPKIKSQLNVEGKKDNDLRPDALEPKSVDGLYMAVLGRSADAHGMQHYLSGVGYSVTQVADELRSDPHAEIMRPHLCNGTCGERARAGDRAAFPIVGASGMGDSCFNAGMMSIVRCDFAHLFAHFSLTFCSPLPSLFVTAPPRSTWAYTADAYPRVTT